MPRWWTVLYFSWAAATKFCDSLRAKTRTEIKEDTKGKNIERGFLLIKILSTSTAGFNLLPLPVLLALRRDRSLRPLKFDSLDDNCALSLFKCVTNDWAPNKLYGFGELFILAVNFPNISAPLKRVCVGFKAVIMMMKVRKHQSLLFAIEIPSRGVRAGRIRFSVWQSPIS